MTVFKVIGTGCFTVCMSVSGSSSCLTEAFLCGCRLLGMPGRDGNIWFSLVWEQAPPRIQEPSQWTTKRWKNVFRGSYEETHRAALTSSTQTRTCNKTVFLGVYATGRLKKLPYLKEMRAFCASVPNREESWALYKVSCLPEVDWPQTVFLSCSRHLVIRAAYWAAGLLWLRVQPLWLSAPL